MKKKLRIFSHIAIICLSVCMFAFGVYAANQVSVTTSGTVSFTATGVYARITGSIAGVSESGLTYAELTTNADGTITGDVSSWANKNVTFNSGNEITLTITVQNLATEEGRNVYATLYDIDQPEKLITSMQVGTEYYLASTVIEIAPNTSKTFQVKLSPRDLNTSFTADYEYLLDLDSDKLNSERIESKIKTGVNNSDMGSISYSLDSTKTKLTLTATPNDGYNFLGFTGGSANDGDFVFLGESYQYTNLTETSLNLNIYDQRGFYAVFYSDKVSYGFNDTTSSDIYSIYLGSAYATVYAAGLKMSSPTGEDIPTSVEYNGDEYKISFIADPGGGSSALSADNTNFVPPKHISAIYSPYYLYYSARLNNDGSWNEGDPEFVLLPENIFYIDHRDIPYILNNDYHTSYLDSKYLINFFSEETLYWDMASSCVNFYINESIVEYVQYNAWFAESYVKAESTTEFNGANYYLYTYISQQP